MRWRDRKGSDNVEDRRDETGGGFGFPFPRGRGGGFPGGRFPIPTGKGGGIGIFGVLIILGLMFLFGIDPRVILQEGGGGGGGGVPFPRSESPGRDGLPGDSAPSRDTPMP